ncbi:hypothetical protein [Methylobacterium oryzae]|uniref:hypothetical protein n=1 Tax=Methylobacterium oryzae TaxID=334852 RepID=UPI002257F379|nr:hypothetical protein [Methylobacterium organophilum]
MSATRSLWRSLLAVFLTVTLVAFSVAGAGHAHAGARHVDHAQVTAEGLPEASWSEQALDLSHRAERAGDGATASPCGLNCCHASTVRWDFPAMAVGWKLGQTLSGIRKIAFDSLVPETLSEPPRTFA